MELKICHLYPDVLNLYGDRGNVICMEKRLQWRGIDVITTGVAIGDALHAADHDLFFIGGGQDFEEEVLIPDLRSGKDQEIKAAIEDGKPFLAICGGYQMLGASYETCEGQKFDFVGALDLYTVGAKERMIGDYAFTCDELDATIVGFENHSGKTYLGSSVKPMGKVLAGHGNNGEDGTEGVRYQNVFGTYAHGCLLPKNPKLADYLLTIALERKYGAVQLEPLEDQFEHDAHAFMEKRLLSK